MLACILCQGWMDMCWFQSWLVCFRWGTLDSSSCCSSLFMQHSGWNCLESWVSTYYSSLTPFDAYFLSSLFQSFPPNRLYVGSSEFGMTAWVTLRQSFWLITFKIVCNNTKSLYVSICSLQFATRTTHVREWVDMPPLKILAWHSSPSFRCPLETTGTASWRYSTMSITLL